MDISNTPFGLSGFEGICSGCESSYGKGSALKLDKPRVTLQSLAMALEVVEPELVANLTQNEMQVEV